MVNSIDKGKREKAREYFRKWALRNAPAYTAYWRKRNLHNKARLLGQRLLGSMVRDDFKLQIGCQLCGYNKCSRALSFHHVGDKIRTIARTASLWARLDNEPFIDELNQCVLLCANCHMELTGKETL